MARPRQRALGKALSAGYTLGRLVREQPNSLQSEGRLNHAADTGRACDIAISDYYNDIYVMGVMDHTSVYDAVTILKQFRLVTSVSVR